MEPAKNYSTEKIKQRQLATHPIVDEIVRWSQSQTPPFMDVGWLLEIRGGILDLVEQWKNYELLIKTDLSVAVFNQGLHWLAVEWAPEEEEITHPLIPFTLLQVKENDSLLNLWREKRAKLRVLVALYNFLLGDDTHAVNSVSENNYDNISIEIPQRWVSHLAMSRHPMYESTISYISQSLGIDIIEAHDAAEAEQQLSLFSNRSSDLLPAQPLGHVSPGQCISPHVSISDLCIAPLTPDLLASLLKELGVLEQIGPPYRLYKGVEGLKGKGRNRISKTVAAFQVLSEEGLFSKNRGIWPSAALIDYSLPIGRKAMRLRYNGHGERYSDSYNMAADFTNEWISKQTQLNTDFY